MAAFFVLVGVFAKLRTPIRCRGRGFRRRRCRRHSRHAKLRDLCLFFKLLHHPDYTSLRCLELLLHVFRHRPRS